MPRTFWGVWVSTWRIGSDLSHLGPELGPRSPVKVVILVFWDLNLIFYILPPRLSSQLDIRVLTLKLLVDSFRLMQSKSETLSRLVNFHAHVLASRARSSHFPPCVVCAGSHSWLRDRQYWPWKGLGGLLIHVPGFLVFQGCPLRFRGILPPAERQPWAPPHLLPPWLWLIHVMNKFNKQQMFVEWTLNY